jgi:CubicO group peptidase (beta-lactamase class C family)
MMNPRSMTFKAFTNPKAITKLPDINTRGLLEIELPSVNGTGTARAIATVYGELATGGSKLGLRRETVDELERRVPAGFDEIFGIESAFALGFMKPFPILPFGSSPKAYGHTGSGGSFGYADPDARVGYAYVMNRNGYALPTDPREVALRNALADALT